MLIPDPMLPLALERSAAELGRVLLDLAVDMGAVVDGNLAEAVRDNMSPMGRPPRMLRNVLAETIAEGEDSARALCYWDASIGMDLVLLWNEGKSPCAAWIVVSGQHVLHTEDVSNLPFAQVDVHGGRMHPRT